MTTECKRPRGRPRKAKPAPPPPEAHHFDPDLSDITAAHVVEAWDMLIGDADALRWYHALARAVEGGDARAVGYFALGALKHLQHLNRNRYRRLSEIGEKELQSDKRRGHRGRSM